jgi:hypothetical protein
MYATASTNRNEVDIRIARSPNRRPSSLVHQPVTIRFNNYDSLSENSIKNGFGAKGRSLKRFSQFYWLDKMCAEAISAFVESHNLHVGGRLD